MNSAEPDTVIEPQAYIPGEPPGADPIAYNLGSTVGTADDPKVPLSWRCLLHGKGGIYMDDIATFVIDGAVFSYYSTMSDIELQSLADSGTDGFAQYLYAYDRYLDVMELTPDDPEVSRNRLMARIDSPGDQTFRTAEQYFIGAVKNYNWIAANRLAAMYEPFDRIDARAWLLVEQEAGGTTLARMEEAGEGAVYSESEKNESVLRAQALIDEFDLGPGLSTPDDCLASLQ